MAGTRIDILIGRGAAVRGNVAFTGTVRVDGTVAGERVEADQIVVGAEGLIQAEIRCNVLEVAGVVCGHVHVAQRVTIHSSGRVRGDIHCGQLTVAAGGFFEGRSYVTDQFAASQEGAR